MKKIFPSFTLLILLYFGTFLSLSSCLPVKVVQSNLGTSQQGHVRIRGKAKAVSVTSRKKKNSTEIRHVIRQQCSAEGFPFADALSSIKCKSLSDLLTAGLSEATTGIGSFETDPSSDLQDEDLNDLSNEFISPLLSGMGQNLAGLTTGLEPASSILGSNICMGNFDDASEFVSYKGVCSQLPIDEGEWTVFGFALDVGIGSPFNSMCTGVTEGLGTYAAFCVAMSTDSCATGPIKIPSVVFAIAPVLLKCSPFTQLLAAASGGTSTAVVQAVAEAVDSYVFGVSLNNDFTEDFKTYDGDKIVPSFQIKGTFYDAAYFEIDAESLGIPAVFQFSGESIRVTTINGDIDKAKSAITTMATNAKKSAEKALAALASIEFSILQKMTLKMSLAFSELSGSGSGQEGSSGSSLALALPDSSPFEIGTASLFATTFKVTSGSDELPAGVYMYTSASPANIFKALFSYVLTFTAEIINFLPDWTPNWLELDANALAQSMKTSGTSDGDFALALAINVADETAVIFLKIPLIIDALGYIEFKCTIDFGNESFKCSIKTDFNENFFAAIGEALEDGVMWVARELEDLGEDILESSGEVLAAGMSTLGDAADDVGSAFSTATVAATALAIENGEIALEQLNQLKDAVESWAKKAGGDIGEFFEDLGDAVEDGVQIIGNAGETVINEASKAYNDAKDKIEDVAEDLIDSMGCAIDSIVDAAQGQSSSCNYATGLKDVLDAAGNVVNAAVREIEKAYNDVKNSISDAFDAIGDWIGELLSTRRERLREVIYVNSSGRDSKTGCKLKMYRKKIEKLKRNWPWESWKHDGWTYQNIGKQPLDSCVEENARKMAEAIQLAEDAEPFRVDFEAKNEKASACHKATSLTFSELKSSGLTCSTTHYYDSSFDKEVSRRVRIGSRRVCTAGIFCRTVRTYRTFTEIVRMVPTRVECRVPFIRTNGNLGTGNSREWVTENKDVEFLRTGLDTSVIDSLRSTVAERIEVIMAANCNP